MINLVGLVCIYVFCHWFQIEMAHKVLSSDMAELVASVKLAQQHASTLLEPEYRKRMLKAAHILAMDSKNLLDAVDSGRSKLSELREGIRGGEGLTSGSTGVGEDSTTLNSTSTAVSSQKSNGSALTLDSNRTDVNLQKRFTQSET